MDLPRISRRAFTQGAASLLVAAPALAATGDVTATASLDAGPDPVAFDRMIFGQFLEHFHRQVYGGVLEPGSPLADKRGFRLDVVEAMKELCVPIVRWPGGCFVSAYHWQDGVGKVRQRAFNKAWGVEDPNTFGTDEFVAWCRMIGAEPYICTNAGMGTVEEMSDWVEYCNLKGTSRFARMRTDNGNPAPLNVKYWSIGNENYFGTEIGSKTVAEWGMLVREAAKVMRAVDSELVLLAAANTDNAWTGPLLQTAGGYLDYISIHGYWDALWERGTKPASYLQAMMRSRQPEEQIEGAIRLIAENKLQDRVKIAFDEWNLRSWHHPGFPGGGGNRLDLIKDRDENDRNEVYTMADALFSASFLNGCLRHADTVRMACLAPVINVRGPLFVHPRGVVKRTTFHVMKMYSDLLQPRVVKCAIESAPLKLGDESVPQVDVLPTCSEDRRTFAVAIVNRHPTAPARVRLGGLKAGGGRLVVLDGDSPDAYNDIARPTRVAPREREVRLENGALEVPSHSLSILVASA